jgi:TRAP-type C4-dicarboxylate transport system permease small subunit
LRLPSDLIVKIENVLVTNLCGTICGISGLVILIIALFQIFLRVTAQLPLPWVFELSALLAVYAVFFGSVVLIIKDNVAKVEYFVNHFPPTIRVLSWFVSLLAFLVLGCVLIYGAIAYHKLLKAYTMSNLPLPSTLFSYPIMVFGFALVIRGLIMIRKRIVRGGISL